MAVHEGRGRTAARSVLRGWIRDGVLPPLDDALQEPVVAAALDEGLGSLLAAAIPLSWPAPLRARLHDHRRRALFTAVQQLDTLAWAAALLEGHGLRSLPLKGAALAEDLYETPGERPMCDVDLLVLDAFDEAARLLQAEGLVLVDRGDHALALRTPAGVILELHRSATSCPGLFALDADALWARRRRGAGQVRELPAREDLLVLLALHAAFQHGLELRLVQYIDFRRLLQAPLDSALVLAVAGRMGARAALGAALRAAQAVVHAPVPPALQTCIDLAPRGDRRRLSLWCGPLAAQAAAPPLARMRWLVARGRRAALLRTTLAGSGERGVLPRLVTLLRRWTVPTLRSWWPRRRAA